MRLRCWRAWRRVHIGLVAYPERGELGLADLLRLADLELGAVGEAGVFGGLAHIGVVVLLDLVAEAGGAGHVELPEAEARGEAGDQGRAARADEDRRLAVDVAVAERQLQRLAPDVEVVRRRGIDADAGDRADDLEPVLLARFLVGAVLRRRVAHAADALGRNHGEAV